MAYKRLSFEERLQIYKLITQRLSQKEIASQLSRAKSTICDEIKRTKNYCPYLAQLDADQKGLLRKKKPLLEKDNELRKRVESRLYQKWSPEQISGYFKRSQSASICPETIYSYIYNQEGEKRHKLILCLRQKKKRRKRNSLKNKRNTIRNMVSIHLRDKEAENRENIGHWEGDLVIGVKHNSSITTLVERASRYIISLPNLDGRQAHMICLNVCGALGALPSEARRSLTWDRGSEMSKHERLTELINMPVYFADPYRAYQRGSNENSNGLLRDYFPKGTDFNEVSWHDLLLVTEQINNRPRKSLNYHTPKEVYEKFLVDPKRKLSEIIND